MLDLGFDEEVGEIMNESLPASASNAFVFRDVSQEVSRFCETDFDLVEYYVKQEAKIVYLLECLQKTATSYQ